MAGKWCLPNLLPLSPGLTPLQQHHPALPSWAGPGAATCEEAAVALEAFSWGRLWRLVWKA